jgi:hypothetical protein
MEQWAAMEEVSWAREKYEKSLANSKEALIAKTKLSLASTGLIEDSAGFKLAHLCH